MHKRVSEGPAFAERTYSERQQPANIKSLLFGGRLRFATLTDGYRLVRCSQKHVERFLARLIIAAVGSSREHQRIPMEMVSV